MTSKDNLNAYIHNLKSQMSIHHILTIRLPLIIAIDTSLRNGFTQNSFYTIDKNQKLNFLLSQKVLISLSKFQSFLKKKNGSPQGLYGMGNTTIGFEYEF